jgi:hypothetical protein
MVNPPGLSVAVVFLCLCAASAQGDTIYTCAGRNGGPVLQNMPCDTDSAVSVRMDVRAPISAPLAPGTAQGAPGAATAADVPGTATDTTGTGSGERASLPNEPEVGMTQQQVRAILGLPTAITQEEASQGLEITWIYDDSRVLQFDASGRLSKK